MKQIFNRTLVPQALRDLAELLERPSSTEWVHTQVANAIRPASQIAYEMARKVERG